MDNQGSQVNPEQQTETAAASPQLSAPPEDYLLQDLVELAEIGLEFGVTLYVSGGIVTGVITGGKRFFGTFLDSIEQGTPDGAVKDALKQRFAPYLDLYDGDPSDRPAPRFIHPRDARTWTPDGSLGPPAPWRGQIRAISAFSLGVFGPAKEHGG